MVHKFPGHLGRDSSVNDQNGNILVVTKTIVYKPEAGKSLS